MPNIHEIRLKSNAYVASLNVNIAMAVEKVEEQILDLNRKQMLNSKGADDKPLVHSKTGSSRLSPAYARRTGKSRPNIFQTGAFQREMVLDFRNNLDYAIGSNDFKIKFLPDNYKNLLGIAKSNQPKAFEITTKAIREDWTRKVLR